LVKIFGEDISRVVESFFSNPQQHDGEYMTIRAHALHMIATHMYHGMDMTSLLDISFSAWNPVWKERLASDLEFLGYSVSFDDNKPESIFADAFLMEVRWSKKAQRTTTIDVARFSRMHPQFSDSESDDEF
jgi:hypothetical protein